MRVSVVPKLVWMGRVLVGGVLVWAAVSKAIHMDVFVYDLGSYRLVPSPLVVPMAWGVMLLEAWIGGSLLVGVATKLWLKLSAVLFGVFSLGILSAWLRGLEIRCGCFGVSSAEAEYGIWLARNAVLIALCVGLWLWEKGLSEEKVAS